MRHFKLLVLEDPVEFWTLAVGETWLTPEHYHGHPCNRVFEKISPITYRAVFSDFPDHYGSENELHFDYKVRPCLVVLVDEP